MSKGALRECATSLIKPVTVGALLYGEGGTSLGCGYDGWLLALTPISCYSLIEVYNASGTELFLVS